MGGTILLWENEDIFTSKPMKREIETKLKTKTMKAFNQIKKHQQMFKSFNKQFRESNPFQSSISMMISRCSQKENKKTSSIISTWIWRNKAGVFFHFIFQYNFH